MLAELQARAALLEMVARAAPPELRAWHPYGIADAIGFVGMGCVEILVHTDDIARAFGVICQPPADLCQRVVGRMFPWAPIEAEPWSALRWATGRQSLPNAPDVGPKWIWLSRPLAEWDGQMPPSR